MTRRKRPSHRGGSRFHYFALTIAGWTFMVLGVLGLFLPILQGVLFLAVGIVLLSLVSPRIRYFRMRLGRRHPALRRHLDAARAWISTKLRKK